MTNHIINILKHIEWIFLNVASFGYLGFKAATQDTSNTIITKITTLAEMDMIEEIPGVLEREQWLSILIGLSIVFYNVSRGVSFLKKSTK
jgi:hypothetical protein